MVERNRHCVNLYNANIDAAPDLRASLPSLRKQLVQWERSQGEMSAKNVPTEKHAKAWLRANQHAYMDLIAQARSTLPSNISEHAKNSEK